MEEIRQSIIIILQCLNQIPLGEIIDDSENINKKNNLNSMELLIKRFKYYSENTQVLNNNNYQSVESPKGEFGVFLDIDNYEINRCGIRSPGYFHLQGLDRMVKNCMIADLVTVIGSQDVVFGEIDR